MPPGPMGVLSSRLGHVRADSLDMLLVHAQRVANGRVRALVRVAQLSALLAHRDAYGRVSKLSEAKGAINNGAFEASVSQRRS